MKYASNGAYNISRLEITSVEDFTGFTNTIDLTKAFVSLDLYESIWENVMSGSVSILDTINLPDLLPLNGGEQINVEFNTLGNEGNPVEYVGVAYKISEKHRISEHSNGFTIHFTSEPFLKSIGTKVQRSYKDVSSNIVQDLYSRFGVQTPLEIEPTKTISSWVFGNVQVLTAINRLCYGSHSTAGDHGYLFYENNKGFNFKPLEFLFKQKPVTEYFYRNKGVYKDVSQRAAEVFNSIQDVEMLERNNLLERLHDGQHGRKNLRFDLVSKQFETYQYDRDSDYDQFKSLGNYPFKKPIDVNYDNFSRLDYVASEENDMQNEAQSIMVKKFLKSIKARIIVFGDSFIKAGDVCRAELPNWNVQQGFLKNTIDGKFLITAIRHSLTEEAYTQVLTLEKDAYDEGFELE